MMETLLNVRSATTSELIARMNPEVLADLLGDAVTQSDIAALISVIAAEIDRRIPVPSDEDAKR